MNLLNKERL